MSEKSNSDTNTVSQTDARDEPPNYSLEDDKKLLSDSSEIRRRVSVSPGSDDSSVDEEYEVASIASSKDELLTWRGRMQVVLRSHNFHLIIVALVVLDAIIIVFELLLGLGAFQTLHCFGEHELEKQEFCHFDPNFRHMCGAPAQLILEGLVIAPHGANHSRPPCTCGYRGGQRVCIPTMKHGYADKGVSPTYVLHILSVIILSIFMVEVMLKMIAFRLRYFTRKFEVFDGIIVTISWLLDFMSLIFEEPFEAAILLISLRFWRILRVVNGSVLASKAKTDEHYKEAKNEAKRIIHAFHKARDLSVTLEKENERLQKMLESAGYSLDFSSRTSADLTNEMMPYSNEEKTDQGNGMSSSDPRPVASNEPNRMQMGGKPLPQET